MSAAVPSSRLQVPSHPRHPRRTPASSSVSLRHAMANALAEKRSVSTSSSESNKAQNDSPSSLQPLMGRGSSGESSNAEQWFNKTNTDVREGGSTFRDHEPPFFMRNTSSLETPPNGRRKCSNEGEVSDSLPLRTELLRMNTDGSGTDDFRSVIDDLTVQNKKLKRRLKKYEKLHDAHLKDDKLFEVRIHGLPTEKKRELEDMLRKFASSLGTTGENAFPTDGYNTLLPMLNKEMSQVTHHQSDSAYATMSLSGPGSSAVSATDRKFKKTPLEHLSARQKNIHSYLHDIPVGLQPQQAPANMTERAKKKLVVRKMEQLFVGKGAVGGHHQPLQQQEVSLSAAQADRSDRARAGQSAQAYGAREAQILKRKKSTGDRTCDKETSSEDAPSQGELSKQSSGEEKPGYPQTEQRPTQPIDLDPDRAQVPRDNIAYMRSMGFSPPHPDATPEDGHGWIYINFLFNMAQLHTLHVTTDFVREAMSEISKKLEVSSDGRKVRWRGGRSVTHGSSGEVTPRTGTSSENHDQQSPRKRMKMANGNGSTMSNGQAYGRASARVENSRHAYTPMFHHKSSNDGSDDSSSEEEEEEDTGESDIRWGTLGNSSGAATSSGMQASTAFNITGMKRKKKAKRDDGPIIFYNNARFCTDLSGERRPMANHNVPLYTTFAPHAIGEKYHWSSDAEGRGPLADASILPEPMDLDDNRTASSQELSFPSYSAPSSVANEEPIDLEVTGIGGVWPSDNFVLDVETRHARVKSGDDQDSTLAVSRTLAPRFANMCAGSEARNKSQPNFRHEVTDVEVTKLQPSALPPALGFMDYDDETSYSSDDDGDESPEPIQPDNLPEVGVQPVDFGHRYSSSDADEEEEESSDESEEESDDGEVDLLAGIRAANPEFVRAQEREYDAAIAERLAEEIPAGSSAATAGGGSGYASPVSGVGKEDARQARRALGARVPVRRERTGSSMAVHGRESSEKGDDSDGDDVDEGVSDVGS